jgi:outer membrane protein TolC
VEAAPIRRHHSAAEGSPPCVRPYSLSALGVALTGCAVGPTYQRPDVPVPAQWQVNIQQANDFANTTWWDQFGDPELNRLIQIALEQNKDLQIATARVQEYLGRYGVTRAAQFPQIGANAAGSRTRYGENTVPCRNRPDQSTAIRSIWARRSSWICGASCAAPPRPPAPNCWRPRKPERTVILSLVGQLANSYVLLLDYDQQLVVTKATLQTRSEVGADQWPALQGGADRGAGLSAGGGRVPERGSAGAAAGAADRAATERHQPAAGAQSRPDSSAA